MVSVTPRPLYRSMKLHGPRADTDTVANFTTVHSPLESICDSEVVQPAQMLLTHLTPETTL